MHEIRCGFGCGLRGRAHVEARADLRDFPEDAAAEALELLDAFCHVLEEGADQRGNRDLHLLERALEHLLVVGDQPARERVDERAFRCEVAEDGGARDARLLGHLGHGRVFEAPVGEEQERRLEDALLLLESGFFIS